MPPCDTPTPRTRRARSTRRPPRRLGHALTCVACALVCGLAAASAVVLVGLAAGRVEWESAALIGGVAAAAGMVAFPMVTSGER